MTSQELIDWYKANKSIMPKNNFDLDRYLKVSDPIIFFKKIDKDIDEYPDIFGRQRLIMHLNLLHKMIVK